LSLNEQKNKYRALDDWFNSPQGCHVSKEMSQQLSVVQDILSGVTLLQLGVCGAHPWLDVLDFRRKWLLTPCIDVPDATFITSLKRLPLERNSVDCVIAPLTIEAFERDKNPLDEIDRVLKPMGHAVFFGINPLSLWGLSLKSHHLACFGDYKATLTSSIFLKQALLMRGYRQCLLETFYYIPPVKRASWIHHLTFLNEMGKMIAPCPAGFYCLVVQKYQHVSPTLLQRSKKQRFILQESQSIGLATRVHHLHRDM
jgi:hypothetical protein